MHKTGNFWEKISLLNNGPIFCLAPMADVTDATFRYVIAKCSKGVLKGNPLGQNSSRVTLGGKTPFVTYTEFVSADGLVLAPGVGKKKLLKDLEYDEMERPVVAQLFTSKPEMMEKAAMFVAKLGFDGLDINMGCPDKGIEKQGAGAALMKNPKLAREIIAAAKRGVENAHKDDPCIKGKCGVIPVSVKTRLGYDKDELETWLPELLAESPTAIIIHARTRKEMSKVPARWERIKRAVEIKNEVSRLNLDVAKTLIIGNGDLKSLKDAKEKCEETGAGGAMFGRAILGNPWLFSDYKPTVEERLQILIEHTKLFEKKFAGVKSFAIMKKHFKEYLKSPALRDLRFKLMRAENAEETEKIIENYF